MKRFTAGLIVAAATYVLGASPSLAGDLLVEVRTPDGRPVRDAVVSFKPARGSPPASSRLKGPFQVAQQDISFQPYVLVVPVGAEVVFPNRDRVRHHVYSFSKPKKFELRLYGREEMRSVKFDQPGVVALGCNIHDRMSGYVAVVDTPFAAKSGADGRVNLGDLPAEAGTLTIWHPLAKGAPQVRPLAARPNWREAVTLELRPPAPVAGM